MKNLKRVEEINRNLFCIGNPYTEVRVYEDIPNAIEFLLSSYKEDDSIAEAYKETITPLETGGFRIEVSVYVENDLENTWEESSSREEFLNNAVRKYTALVKMGYISLENLMEQMSRFRSSIYSDNGNTWMVVSHPNGWKAILKETYHLDKEVTLLNPNDEEYWKEWLREQLDWLLPSNW